MPINKTIRHTAKWSRGFHNWLFAQSTRIVEFMNMCLLLAFSIPFIYNYDDILGIAIYRKFEVAQHPLWWWGIATISIFQCYYMLKKGVHANQVSGYILLVSGLLWAWIAVTFLTSLPPLTPAPMITGIVSLTCVLAGAYLIKYNKTIEDLYYT